MIGEISKGEHGPPGPPGERGPRGDQGHKGERVSQRFFSFYFRPILILTIITNTKASQILTRCKRLRSAGFILPWICVAGVER